MKIEFLCDKYEDKYEAFTSKNTRNLFYCSNKYRKLLKAYLGCRDIYLMALDEKEEIVGVMPVFLKENTTYGNVLNSLPFYGSNGGVISDDIDAKIELIRAFEQLSEEYNCVSSTIITSPLDTGEERAFYKKNIIYNLGDLRIGQITPLPLYEVNYEDLLRESFHTMVNRCIKKAKANDMLVSVVNSEVGFDFLYRTHKNNIEAIGGLAKDRRFFDLIPLIFEEGKDYNVYIANFDGKMVAALLLFYYNHTVEYFTPATVSEYRTKQPLSLLIFEAMKDAIKKGYTLWNWGGTWTSQEGVYDFKRKWGTYDSEYYYYINLKDKSMLELSKDVLLESYSNFYVLPFNKLRKDVRK